MLTPEELRNAPDKAEEDADELELALLILLIQALIAQENAWQPEMTYIEFQNNVLKAAEKLNETMQPVVRKIMASGAKDIKSTFESYATKAIANQNKMLINAGYDEEEIYGRQLAEAELDDIAARYQIAESQYLKQATERAYTATQGTWSNVCGTRAYTTYDRFVKACDDAYYRTVSGQTTYDEAIKEEIDNLAGGKNPSHDPSVPPASSPEKMVSELSGKEERADVAVPRAVRTGIGQMVGDMTLKRCEEMGIDLVLVSAHIGARPTHYVWQGKVYSLTGKGYPNFYEATGYGTGDGLCGWNCRHSFGPFMEGMHNPYDDMPIDQDENDKRYQLEQEQRRRERAIRAAKRRYRAELEALQGLTPGTEEFEAKESLIKRLEDRLRRMNEEYVQFCEANDLRPLEDRLRIENEYSNLINQGGQP